MQTLADRQPIENPRAPDGVRLYAIGDIHGKIGLLQKLCDIIYEDALSHEDQVKLIFLGDYVDRGEDSKGVVELILSLREAELDVVCVMGNHENAMMQFMTSPENTYDWLLWGGAETLKSYGVSMADGAGKPRPHGELSKLMNEKMPDAHKGFYNGLVTYHVEGDYLFVHGGVRPGVALEDQELEDLLRIRKDFTEVEPNIGKTVVFGHTSFPEPFEALGRIGIDTGAYETNKLTCVALHGDKRYFLSS